jgi:hypothetical protein
MSHPAGSAVGPCPLRRAAALVFVSCLLAGFAVRAQPPLSSVVPAAPARPDTARLGFVGPDSLPAPVALHVLADTVAFGGLLPVVWDLPVGAAISPAGLPTPAGDQLAAVPARRRPWWKGGGLEKGAEVGIKAKLESLPPAPGQRVVSLYRVYRTDPFRLEWAGRTSAVVNVQGRVDDPRRLAAIRDPRAWAWFTTALALSLAALALTVALFWWWWRRRRRGAEPVDWRLPEPAWIGAALALQGLLEERRLERGDPKAFLDGLAAVARRFAAAHYGVPAAELTGCELVKACAARGYDTAQPVAFARLIDGADLRRYDPELPAPGWCRDQIVDLMARLSAAKVQPRQTPVEPERLLAAGRAWAAVAASLPPSAAAPGTPGYREVGR